MTRVRGVIRQPLVILSLMAQVVDLGTLLVGAPPNTPLRVRRILYDAVRTRCADRGLHEGDEVMCLGVSQRHLLVEVPARGTVRLELSLSVCVEVDYMS